MSSLLNNDNFFCEEILKRLPHKDIDKLMTSSSSMRDIVVRNLPDLSKHIRAVNERITDNHDLVSLNNYTTSESVRLNDGMVYSKQTMIHRDRTIYLLYRNNKRHGPSTSYDKGRLSQITMFKDSMKNGLEVVYDGKNNYDTVLKQRTYKNDMLHGKSVVYRQGFFRDEQEYEYGRRHGRFERWSEDNTLLSDGNYTNGKKDGIFNKWNREGNLVQSVNYSNDKITTIFTTKYNL